MKLPKLLREPCLSTLFVLCAFLGVHNAVAQTVAPDAPGKDSQWPSAGKQGVGTSFGPESKVWFTLQGGMLTEVFYPRIDTANVNLLQFVIVDPETKTVETERDDATHEIKPLRDDALTFQQINTAKSGDWKIIKTYTTDPTHDTVLIEVRFERRNRNLNLYVYYDPSLGNSGMGDNAYSPLGQVERVLETPADGTEQKPDAAQSSGLGADDGDIATAVLFSSNVSEFTNGYFGTSDGLEQLRQFGKIETPYASAKNGNVVQMAKIDQSSRFTVVLGFARGEYGTITAAANAAKSLEKGFSACRTEYEKGWSDYVKTLPKVDAKYRAQFNMAAMVLKAFEDKTYRGAGAASLSVPWGGGNNGNNVTTGYHLVWSRDLYQVATAWMALGDSESARRAVDYLFTFQQRDDGSFPQISWLDGRTVGDSIQMDEISYPLILAYQLGKTDKPTYDKHIRRSADYIAKNGPFTKQERWEEESGYSPSTIAAEIAALVCAAEIARINNDQLASKRWLAIADNWNANLENWTATKTGKYGDGKYYLRLSQRGRPDSGEKLELGNGAGTFDEREIVDAGFLELVRLGLRRADDPLIVKSLKVVDQQIKATTPNGEVWFRYNHDGYGDTYDGKRWNWDATWRGNGHPWPLLTGERGQYEIALAGLKKLTGPGPRVRLDAMMNFANDGLMIPEQVWEKADIPKTIDIGFLPPLKHGEGNGSATPLAWSMAQFIRLALNIQAGKNLETPDIVFNRYAGKKK